MFPKIDLLNLAKREISQFQGYPLGLLQQLRVGRLQSHSPTRSRLRNCLCLPLTSIDNLSLRMRGGIFREDRSYVYESGLVTNGKEIVGPGKEKLPEPSLKLTGHSLYLGVCHYTVDYHSAPPVKQSKFSSSFTFHEKAQVNEIKKNYIIAGLGGWSAGTA